MTFPLIDPPFLRPTCLLCGTRYADGTWLVVVEMVETPSPGRFGVRCRAPEHRHF